MNEHICVGLFLDALFRLVSLSHSILKDKECYQQHAGKCLPTGTLGTWVQTTKQKMLICSICWLPRYKFSKYGQFQDTLHYKLQPPQTPQTIVSSSSIQWDFHFFAWVPSSYHEVWKVPLCRKWIWSQSSPCFPSLRKHRLVLALVQSLKNSCVAYFVQFSSFFCRRARLYQLSHHGQKCFSISFKCLTLKYVTNHYVFEESLSHKTQEANKRIW